MTIISTDTETAFVFDHAGQLLIVKQGVVVAVEGAYAVADGPLGSGFGGCFVGNYGAIYSNYTGVVMTGDNATVINQAGGSIVGVQGVYLGGGDGHLDNQGDVYGSDIAVELAGFATSVGNTGLISSNTVAIKVTATGGAWIDNNGTITSPGHAILASANVPFIDVNNTGLIVGDIAVEGTVLCKLRNSGAIDGNILFGASDDRYDGRGGEAAWLVSGHLGADTLIGGGGDDVLYGGDGADRLKAGGGADEYVYTQLVQSRGKAVDVIRGWDAADAIDLSQVDVNAVKAGTQNFTFGGLISAGDPVGNDMVQYYRKGGDTFVVADATGDGKADFLVRIVGSFTLDAGDFVLG